MDNARIVLKDLSKKIGNTALVRDIDLSLEEKTILLLGENESGKTLLLKLLAGLLTPDCGSIAIDGLSPRDAVLAGWVAYLSPIASLPEHLTPPELLDFLAKTVPAFDKERAQSLLFDLRIKQNKQIKFFSKSTKTKIGLIITMCRSAKLYFLDIPNMVDEVTRDYLLRIVCENRSEGSSVILSTKDPTGTEALTDVRITLEDGKLLPFDEGGKTKC